MEEIGAGAFVGCTSLASINIPDSVTVIESETFKGCTSLTSVTIPDSVTVIKSEAFSGCTSLASVTVPASVSKIGDEAFKGCTSLASIKILSSVIKIGEKVFEGCDNLTYRTYSNAQYIGDKDNPYLILIEAASKDITKCIVSNKTKIINSSAFIDCRNLTNIEFSNLVTYIDDGTFENCTSLTLVTIPDSVKIIGNEVFKGCTGLTSVTIPDSVKIIGNEVFKGCTSLTSVTIPDSVKVIGHEAFKGCTSLTSVAIPDSVKAIGREAFKGCTSLTSVAIPESVKVIMAETFKGCTSLASVAIPGSVKVIGDEAFYGCTSLTSVALGRNKVDIGKKVFTKCKVREVRVPETPSNVIRGAFTTRAKFIVATSDEYVEPNVKKIKAPNLSGAWIEDGVLKTYTGNRTEVVIPEGVEKIGFRAFEKCKKLVSVIIPDTVKAIEGCAFIECISLSSITIPYSVTKIDGSAFLGCSNLSTIEVSSQNKNFVSIDGALYSSDLKELLMVPATRTSFKIPNSVTQIGECAFADCSGLTSIRIPDTVKVIGKEAFQSCSSLRSITIPDSVETIENYAFGDCESLTSVTLPSDLASIGMGIFQSCKSLSSIHIPDTVSYIDEQAFCRCESLTSVTIPNSVESIGEFAFCDCKNLKTVTIPESVTSIGTKPFDGCKQLSSIIVPSSVMDVVGTEVFDGYNVVVVPSQKTMNTGDEKAKKVKVTIKGEVVLLCLNKADEEIVSDLTTKIGKLLSSKKIDIECFQEVINVGIIPEYNGYVGKKMIKLPMLYVTSLKVGPKVYNLKAISCGATFSSRMPEQYEATLKCRIVDDKDNAVNEIEPTLHYAKFYDSIDEDELTFSCDIELAPGEKFDVKKLSSAAEYTPTNMDDYSDYKSVIVDARTLVYDNKCYPLKCNKKLDNKELTDESKYALCERSFLVIDDDGENRKKGVFAYCWSGSPDEEYDDYDAYDA